MAAVNNSSRNTTDNTAITRRAQSSLFMIDGELLSKV